MPQYQAAYFTHSNNKAGLSKPKFTEFSFLREKQMSLFTLAPGVVGVAKRTAQTAPNGAIVIDTPFGANI